MSVMRAMFEDATTKVRLNGWDGECSGICREASYRGKHLTLAECGRNGRFKNKR